MRTPERPFGGEGSEDNGTPSYDWLDEWLCEYVDGTMDPSLEAVFDKYVDANPELKAHVKRLRKTRELLCGCDVPEEPSVETQADVCTEVEQDLLETSSSPWRLVGNRRLAALGLASSVAVALVVGFIAGSMLAEPVPQSSSRPTPTVEQRAPVPQDLPPRFDAPRPSFQFDASLFPAARETSEQQPERADRTTPDTVEGTSTFTAVDAR